MHRVVNIFLVFLLSATISPSPLNCQVIKNGVYSFSNRVTNNELSIENGVFKKKTIGMEGTSTYYKGYFVVSSDTLALSYIPYSQERNRKLNVSQRSNFDPNDSNSLGLDLQILDINNVAISGAIVSILDHEGNIVLTFVSDINGVVEGLYLSSRSLNKIRISFIGKNEVEILLGQYWGWNNKMELNLFSDKEYFSNDYFLERYVFKVLDESQIQLTNLVSGEIFILHNSN